MVTTQGTCLRCERHLVATQDWAAMGPASRRFARAANLARTRGRGLCNGCYAYFEHHGELERFAPLTRPAEEPPPTSGRCTRCGLDGPILGDLCRDCADVTHDLGERSVWA